MKWYIGSLMAEGECAWTIQLSKEEANAVRRFLHSGEIVFCDSWCGSCSISEKGYDIEEEAIEVIKKGEY